MTNQPGPQPPDNPVPLPNFTGGTIGGSSGFVWAQLTFGTGIGGKGSPYSTSAPWVGVSAAGDFVVFVGMLAATGSVSASSTILTGLPSKANPLVQKFLSQGGGGPSSGLIITTAGVIQNANALTVGQYIVLDGYCYSPLYPAS